MNIGDKVRIKSLDWYSSFKDSKGYVYSEGPIFVSNMSKYCGREARVTKVFENGSCTLDIDGGHWIWGEHAFEETKKIPIPKGWEVDKVENNEIILKQIKFPKTWEECIEKVGVCEYIDPHSHIIISEDPCAAPWNYNLVPRNLGKPLLALNKLLVCREVYRQGWEPNWKEDTPKYSITTLGDTATTCTTRSGNIILSFQSREVRDKFLENFRDLIEEAKEFL